MKYIASMTLFKFVMFEKITYVNINIDLYGKAICGFNLIYIC
jgi:hypothetical protein